MAQRAPEHIHPQRVSWDSLSQGSWDALLVVGPHFDELPSAYQQAIEKAQQVDQGVTKQVSVIPCEEAPGKRLVLAPTSDLSMDYDDVRQFYDAASVAVKRLIAAGVRNPVVIAVGIPEDAAYAQALSLVYFGVSQGIYEPLEAREALGESIVAFDSLGILGDVDTEWLSAVEAGRLVARDICGTEPERMSPPRAAEYCQQVFTGTPVSVNVINDRLQLQHEYPLLSAVARATFAIDKQRPCVVRLEYKGEGTVERTHFFVGKGITYDTGGADLKTDGHMAGMSRDKGGAASVAGFFKVIAQLRPANVRYVAELCFARNNIDALSFVADEIITGHSGVRVRIGNTDAEGRLAMSDALSKAREEALQSPNPSIYTIATLTGHAALAKGPYTAVVPNSPSLDQGIAQRIIDAGEVWGDNGELSYSRREDFDIIRPRTKADDVLSSNNGPSARTARGHQFPMAYLLRVSGLEKHGRKSEQPLAYTHLDIAGSGVENGDWQHGKPRAATVLALSGAFLKD